MALKRLIERKVRVSFFEEIVISFSSLVGSYLMQLPDVDAVELVRNLRSRLSRVLRRDEKINDFEYWMYRYIQRQLDELGY